MIKANNLSNHKVFNNICRCLLSICGGFLGAFTMVASLYLHINTTLLGITASISFIVFGYIMWCLSHNLIKGLIYALSLMIISVLIPPFFNDLTSGINTILTK